MAVIAAGRRAAVAVVARSLLWKSGRYVSVDVKRKVQCCVDDLDLTLKPIASSVLVIHCSSSHFEEGSNRRLKATKSRESTVREDKTVDGCKQKSIEGMRRRRGEG